MSSRKLTVYYYIPAQVKYYTVEVDDTDNLVEELYTELDYQLRDNPLTTMNDDVDICRVVEGDETGDDYIVVYEDKPLTSKSFVAKMLARFKWAVPTRV
tara:strand:- start:3071 stop:3367 length:297 start_codon:yes stop_codon:yes gene_type:complete